MRFELESAKIKTEKFGYSGEIILTHCNGINYELNILVFKRCMGNGIAKKAILDLIGRWGDVNFDAVLRKENPFFSSMKLILEEIGFSKHTEGDSSIVYRKYIPKGVVPENIVTDSPDESEPDEVPQKAVIRSALAGSFRLIKVEKQNPPSIYYEVVTPVGTFLAGTDFNEAEEMFNDCIKSAH